MHNGKDGDEKTLMKVRWFKMVMTPDLIAGYLGSNPDRGLLNKIFNKRKITFLFYVHKKLHN